MARTHADLVISIEIVLNLQLQLEGTDATLMELEFPVPQMSEGQGSGSVMSVKSQHPLSCSFSAMEGSLNDHPWLNLGFITTDGFLNGEQKREMIT